MNSKSDHRLCKARFLMSAMAQSIYPFFLLLTLLNGVAAQKIDWIKPGSELISNGAVFCNGPELDFEVKIRRSHFGIVERKKVVVYVNGSPMSGAKLNRVKLGGDRFSGTVSIDDGENIIFIEYTEGHSRPIRSAPLIVQRNIGLPTLHILALGPKQDLRYNQRDAWDFVNLFRGQATGNRRLYDALKIELLIGKEATRTAARKKVERYKRLARDTNYIKKQDVLIFYASSHGFIGTDGKYYIKMADADHVAITSGALNLEDIMALLDEVPCKKIIFIDACRNRLPGSKGISPPDLEAAIRKIVTFKPGFSIILSSQLETISYEDSRWENGAFTEVLKMGLAGAANTNNDHIVDLTELAGFLVERVPKIVADSLSKYQVPEVYRSDLEDLPFFLVDNYPTGNLSRIPFRKLPPRPEIPPLKVQFSGMRYVKKGWLMRQSEDGSLYQIGLDGFHMDTCEVTYSQFDVFCKATGNRLPPTLGWGRGNRPVVNVTWLDAVRYCNWRSEQKGLIPCYKLKGEKADRVVCDFNANGYRLPTEAEWEWAAKGTQKETASFHDPYKVAWLMGNAGSSIHIVGKLTPNDLGIYDLAGNVWEWCHDWFEEGFYKKSTEVNSYGPHKGINKVIRGGSWRDLPKIGNTVFRNMHNPNEGSDNIGFRCVRRDFS